MDGPVRRTYIDNIPIPTWQSVLSLPEAERIEVVEALLSSLSDDMVELDDDTLEQELQQRSEECRSDPSSSIPWSELKHQR